MTQWFVKDLSQLTGVSVQTLHHYDRIQLLKPSLRLANGYRVYSENDLLKLQQIIALKFFGFELSQIKTLLSQEGSALEHFNKQVKVLEQNGRTLLEGAKALRGIVSTIGDNKSIPWETIIQLIEVYRMAQHLDHDWVRDIFTPDELKQYAAFEKELKGNATLEEKSLFEESWDQLLEAVKSQLKADPNSITGIQVGKQWMDWVNGVYGKKYAHLRTKLFEQGFGEGKGLEEVGLTPEIVVWIEQASNAYWRSRISDILAQVGEKADEELLVLWNEVLDEMYGEETARKQTVYELALNDDAVSPKAKAWLRKISKLS